MRLLLISNSTNAGEAYLEYPKMQIKKFLEEKGVKRVIFVPYAAVTFGFDDYLKKVQDRFSEIGIEVESIHNFSDKASAIRSAEAVVVGGGNTFQLVKMMQEDGIMDLIAQRVRDGVSYIGWSAGSNVACPTLCTTNDMPIVQPQSFNTLDLIPFQINPHYTDAHPDGHAGETREQRIMEYVAANKNMVVAGLREGCMLLLSGEKIELIGERSLRVFKFGCQTKECSASDDINFLLEK